MSARTFKHYLARRATLTIFTFFIILIINFILPRMMPGNPIDRFVKDPSISERERESLIRDFGLDQPIHIQFICYITNVLRGNLGLSFRYYPNTVVNVIMARIPWTLYLLGVSYSLSIILGVFLGAIAGWKKGSKTDITVTGLAIITRSMPVFWFGMILLLIFSYYFGIFPLSGAYTPGISENLMEYIFDVGWHSILPMLTITLILFGVPAILTRNLIINVLSEQYIYTAKCKGLPTRVILFKHALKNIMLPISSYTATLLGFIVSGAVFTETVFSWPGVGRLIYEAILTRDYPLIQGCFLITTVSVLLANFLADVFYSFIDPRVRQQ